MCLLKTTQFEIDLTLIAHVINLPSVLSWTGRGRGPWRGCRPAGGTASSSADRTPPPKSLPPQGRRALRALTLPSPARRWEIPRCRSLRRSEISWWHERPAEYSMIFRAVKFSYTWISLLKDNSVKFLSTSQSVREVDGPDDIRSSVLPNILWWSCSLTLD